MFRGSSAAWIWPIVGLAAALRFVGLWFGLPHPHARPDENTALGGAIAVLSGDPNPHFFHWPSLIFYTFAALHVVASWIKRAFADGPLTTVEFTLLARGLVALAGTLTVLVLFWMTRRISDLTTALVAALFLAVATLHVRESHFAMTDAVMTLLVTLSLALLARALEQRDSGTALRWIAASGMCGGLATSTKYNAAAVAFAMAAAQITLIVRNRLPVIAPRSWMPSMVFALLFVFGFVVATPFSVLDFETFSEAIVFDLTHLSGGHAIDMGRGWSAHLLRSLPFGLGFGIFLAGLAGFVPLVRRYPTAGVPVAVFALALYLALARGETVFFRYILPLVPVFCLTAAVAVRHAANWLLQRVPRTEPTIVTVLAAVVALPSVGNTIWFDVLLARTDTRVIAAAWLTPRLQRGESVHDAGDDYTRLQLDADVHHWLYDANTKSFGDPAGRVPDWLILPETPLRAYARVPVSLQQLASSSQYHLMFTIRGTRKGGGGIYDEQDAFFLPIANFGNVRRPGPTIHIYRRIGRQ